MLMGEARAVQLLQRISPEIRESLTVEQTTAIRQAATDHIWLQFPLDIRLRLPGFGKGLFLVITGGQERRSAARRKRDRLHYRPFTTANIIFAGASLAVLALAAYGLVKLVGA